MTTHETNEQPPDVLVQLKAVLAMPNSHAPAHVPALPPVRGKGPLHNPILSAVNRDDVAVTQALVAACSREQLDGAQALSHAVEHRCLNALRVLAKNELKDNDIKPALKLAVIKKRWDAFRILAEQADSLPELLTVTHLKVLVGCAPSDVMTQVLQRQPDKKWIREAFNHAVTAAIWDSNNRVDMLELVLPMADPRAKRSWALKEAIHQDKEEVIAVLWPHSNHAKVMATFIEEENWTALDRMGLRLPEHAQRTLVRDHRLELPLTTDLVTRRGQAQARIERAQDLGPIGDENERPKRTRYRP